MNNIKYVVEKTCQQTGMTTIHSSHSKYRAAQSSCDKAAAAYNPKMPQMAGRFFAPYTFKVVSADNI